MTLAVRAEGLSKTYLGEAAPVTVFRNLSFELSEGLFAAVMGPSGSGKSTLLHLLGAIDRPDTGRVEVFGRSLEEMRAAERARFRNATIGFVFQFHHLLPEFTSEENVAFPHRIAGLSAGEARRKARGAPRPRRSVGSRGSPAASALRRRAAARRDRPRSRARPAPPPRGRTDRESGRRFGGPRLRPPRGAAPRAGDEHDSRHAQPRSREAM